MKALNAAILEAHAEQDERALAALYRQAAEDTADDQAKAFYLTHAYVFALASGHASSEAIRQRLIEMDREPA